MTMKEKAFKWLEGSVDGIVELESLLSSIPAIAPESGGHGEMRKAESLIGWLGSKGIHEIERFDAPDPARDRRQAPPTWWRPSRAPATTVGSGS